VSGGTVARVSVPLVGFSLTEYATNPHPQFVDRHHGQPSRV
jgi:hypothetical protein